MIGFSIKNYEKEFDTQELEKKHVFYDLYIKSDDPQVLRNQVSEYMTDMDYKILLNELAKFDDNELEETFRGGNVKPIRALIKSAKDNKKGSKYPIAWKTCLILGIVLLALLLVSYRSNIYTNITHFSYSASALVLYGMIAFFVLSLLFFEIKKIVPIFLWAKIIGVYDPTEESANVRVVLAGDCKFKDKDSYSKLEGDMTEMYSELSRKYGNKLDKRQLANSVSSSLSMGPQGSTKLNNKLRDIEKESADLERNFVAGKISEDEYKKMKAQIEAKRQQLDTLFDLING
ncbi:MAG: hypothetical protein OH338_02170 [Candidatus Parvarchaeota archaeon]|nr:hypothetical protein [Candidatus Parvarchaeota archaeon]MCW1294789.1 hypothetical protein [Candidatus Parvarchaeum tengchongense]MCW1295577.1 hypothetical protein [Candidatus Parvarchaeum tengchongense]MCW1298968.1 hypothetical protein [Candidatus Parvarchaeum tengchongense]MCW1312217.1 hypothetical protein [Candidatus Parvarchaeum tengchongense]